MTNTQQLSIIYELLHKIAQELKNQKITNKKLKLRFKRQEYINKGLFKALNQQIKINNQLKCRNTKIKAKIRQAKAVILEKFNKIDTLDEKLDVGLQMVKAENAKNIDNLHKKMLNYNNGIKNVCERLEIVEYNQVPDYYKYEMAEDKEKYLNQFKDVSFLVLEHASSFSSKDNLIKLFLRNNIAIKYYLKQQNYHNIPQLNNSTNTTDFLYHLYPNEPTGARSEKYKNYIEYLVDNGSRVNTDAFKSILNKPYEYAKIKKAIPKLIITQKYEYQSTLDSLKSSTILNSDQQKEIEKMILDKYKDKF